MAAKPMFTQNQTLKIATIENAVPIKQQASSTQTANIDIQRDLQQQQQQEQQLQRQQQKLQQSQQLHRQQQKLQRQQEQLQSASKGIEAAKEKYKKRKTANNMNPGETFLETIKKNTQDPSHNKLNTWTGEYQTDKINRLSQRKGGKKRTRKTRKTKKTRKTRKTRKTKKIRKSKKNQTRRR